MNKAKLLKAKIKKLIESYKKSERKLVDKLEAKLDATLGEITKLLTEKPE